FLESCVFPGKSIPPGSSHSFLPSSDPHPPTHHTHKHTHTNTPPTTTHTHTHTRTHTHTHTHTHLKALVIGRFEMVLGHECNSIEYLIDLYPHLFKDRKSTRLD